MVRQENLDSGTSVTSALSFGKLGPELGSQSDKMLLLTVI